MEYVITIALSLVFGFLGGLASRKAKVRFVPSQPGPEPVLKRGPSLFVSESKRKPKSQTDHDIWLREQGHKP